MGPKKDPKSKSRVKCLLTDGVIRMGVQSQKGEISKAIDWFFTGWFDLETNFYTVIVITV